MGKETPSYVNMDAILKMLTRSLLFRVFLVAVVVGDGFCFPDHKGLEERGFWEDLWNQLRSTTPPPPLPSMTAAPVIERLAVEFSQVLPDLSLESLGHVTVAQAKELTKRLSEADEAIRQHVVFERVSSLLGRVADGVVDATESLRLYVRPLFLLRDLAQDLRVATDALVLQGSHQYEAFALLMDEIVEVAVRKGEGFRQALFDASQETIGKIQERFQAVYSVLKGTETQANVILEALREGFQELAEKKLEKLEKLAKVAETIYGLSISRLVDIWTDVTSGLGKKLEILADAFWTQLVRTFQDKWAEFLDSGNKFVEVIKASAKEAFGNIVAGLLDLVQNIIQ
ncbi:unnamed protein product [Darwinula stevensoni]|uniref:Uncharacterized protein n=1 Tax=Darwinula stevensoni TaxID=69355 RepID=A0A7R9FPC6_9CRUS|nr:unnamed protein product [Darwinula stevensoni]CAG0897813.1 unnamed protein product [Darwinula stevensoni]